MAAAGTGHAQPRCGTGPAWRISGSGADCASGGNALARSCYRHVSRAASLCFNCFRSPAAVTGAESGAPHPSGRPPPGDRPLRRTPPVLVAKYKINRFVAFATSPSAITVYQRPQRGRTGRGLQSSTFRTFFNWPGNFQSFDEPARSSSRSYPIVQTGEGGTTPLEPAWPWRRCLPTRLWPDGPMSTALHRRVFPRQKGL